MATSNRALQQTLRFAHLWIGLVAGLFIVMLGLSGAAIVFRPMLESAAAPKVAERTSPPSLTVVEQRIGSLHPGSQISRLTIPQSTTEAITVQVEGSEKQRLQLFVDTGSGQELGVRKEIAWLSWLADLHQNLLMGRTGRALTGVIGIALLLLSVSGLVSWLAGPHNWKRTLSLPTKGPWRRLNYVGHQWAGLWANLALFAASLTGIVLAYPDAFQQTVRLVSGEPEPAKAERPNGIPGRLPLDRYLHAATSAVPGGVVRSLRMPSRGRSIVSLDLWVPGEVRPKGETTVLLDPSSASVVSIDRPTSWHSPEGLIELTKAVHKIELGGAPVQLASALAGLAPLWLFFSGLQIWWIQRKAASRVSRKSSEPEPAEAATTLVHK